MEYLINEFKNCYDSSNFPTKIFNKKELFDFFKSCKHRTSVEKDGPAFNLVRYKTPIRKNENVIDISAVVLDYDHLDDKQIEIISDKLIPLAHILYTTYSHTESNPHLRIILPLSKPISPSEYKIALKNIEASFTVKFDDCCYKLTQIYYFPSCPANQKDNAVIEISPDGTLVDELIDLHKPVSTTSKRKNKSSSNDSEVSDYLTAKDLIDTYFPNGLINLTGTGFLHYQNGYWASMTGETLKAFIAKTFETDPRIKSVGKVNTYVEAMSQITLKQQSDFTATPNLICVNNGVVNIETDELYEHDPAFHLRHKLDIVYSPDATCPLWLNTLQSLFAADADCEKKIDGLQEYVGFCLVPTLKFHRMLWLYGRGSNGKSVFLHVLAMVVGKNNFTSLMLHELSDRFSGSSLDGPLVNISPEISSSKPLDEARIKAIVAGDPIQVEKKFQSTYSFKPTVRLVAATNVLPFIKDISDGFYRRLIIIEFNRVFSAEEQDHTLPEQLERELNGILIWAMAGLARLKKQNGFTTVPSSTQLVSAYKQDGDPVLRFINEHVKIDHSARLLKNDAYIKFKQFCEVEGLRYPVSKNEFGKRLKAHGIPDGKSGDVRYYKMEVTTEFPLTKSNTRDELKKVELD